MAGGKTIGVLGTPLDKSYPRENRELQERIMRDHLAVSQFPVGSRIYPTNFPARNRVMALMSDATVIVEAGNSSASISQGWEAIRLGRLLYIMKSITETPGLTWPAAMMRYVRRAKVYGRCEATTGIVPFDRLFDQVMSQPPLQLGSAGVLDRRQRLIPSWRGLPEPTEEEVGPIWSPRSMAVGSIKSRSTSLWSREKL